MQQLRSSSNSFPPAGLYPLIALPEPYQTAFRLGSAHHLPGQFLPAQTDWFIQICLLPFMVMYALPILGLVPALISQAIRKPASYGRLWQTLTQQSLPELGFTLLLFLILAVLIGYCTYMAWDMAQSFYRTWHCSRLRKQKEEGYGIVLLSHGLVGRLIDNLGRHNCLWLPRQAIADIAWHRMREEGAKRSYWVNRTRICYVSAKGKKHWLTLEGRIVDLGYSNHGHTDDRTDRALYAVLVKWWKGRSPQ